MSCQYLSLHTNMYCCIRSIVDHVPVSQIVWYMQETMAGNEWDNSCTPTIRFYGVDREKFTLLFLLMHWVGGRIVSLPVNRYRQIDSTHCTAGLEWLQEVPGVKSCDCGQRRVLFAVSCFMIRDTINLLMGIPRDTLSFFFFPSYIVSLMYDS